MDLDYEISNFLDIDSNLKHLQPNDINSLLEDFGKIDKIKEIIRLTIEKINISFELFEKDYDYLRINLFIIFENVQIINNKIMRVNLNKQLIKNIGKKEKNLAEYFSKIYPTDITSVEILPTERAQYLAGSLFIRISNIMIHSK